MAHEFDYDAWFGSVGSAPDWRSLPFDPTPDDDELQPFTDIDVIGVLGFDPLEFEKFDPAQPRDDKGRWSSSGGGSGLKQYAEMVAGMNPNVPTAPGFVAKHGREYKTDDKSFEGTGKPQQCYMNAALAATNNDELTYVEGYVGIHGVPIAHAWTVDKQGVVRDPTLTPDHGPKNVVTGYFGVPINTNYLMRTLVANKVYGILTGQDNYRQLQRLLNDDPNDVMQP